MGISVGMMHAPREHFAAGRKLAESLKIQRKKLKLVRSPCYCL